MRNTPEELPEDYYGGAVDIGGVSDVEKSYADETEEPKEMPVPDEEMAAPDEEMGGADEDYDT